jgi:polysaccharide transporter, PST family
MRQVLTKVTQKINPKLWKIVNNISWLLFDRIIRLGVAFVIVAWIARYLGPEQFGIFNYANSLVAMVAVLSTFGLDQLVVRDLVREPTCKHEALFFQSGS